ncbi:MAG: 2,3-bisphosphoglycerate-independent phosphoglycerate mutase [Tissierellaceae bacterium]|nr:2,3-bisphosphoglycerate-independent phosphoglycerate mutase [Tissierellaceae bacterium]
MKKKVILIIADGVGDRPCDILEGKTPLEYARTPNLDKLAMTGTTGIMDVLGPGIPIGTDLGHMILFGYGQKDYPGRGPIEASGAGLQLEPGDVALRSNFATVDENLNVIDRRAGRIRKNTNLLAASINGMEIDGVKILFKEATEHRAVLVLRGKGLSANITDSDPKVLNGDTKYKKVESTDGSKESIFTANVLNKFLLEANEILKNHDVNKERLQNGELPANFILTRGAGMMPNMKKITDELGFKASCVAAEGTVLGVARLAGFNIVTDTAFTGNLDTNVELKAEYVVKELVNNDFVAVNLKAPDLMGHDNNPKGKVEAIELVDKFVGNILKHDLENTIIAVAADHSTPCERKEHSGDPVPILIAGFGVRRDRIDAFNEVDCSHGGLGRIKGYEFVQILYDYMEIVKKQGN